MTPYYIVPHNIWDKGLNSYELSVLHCLIHHKNNKTDLCNPSITTIAKEIKASRPTVIRARQKLKAVNLINWSNKKKGISSKYEILGSQPQILLPVNHRYPNNKNKQEDINNRKKLKKLLKIKFPNAYKKIYDHT